ncbi:hypothetical protein [Kocuria palustris]|uniref:hypothetical protein n=1 Tax=Kocuria palustris TaxID=71999 RepID=UPI000738D8A6|nr:hypothetical protein [Kocuria palustris]KUG56111.1 hypothetical protein AVL60_04545 [Kocuria palustris]
MDIKKRAQAVSKTLRLDSHHGAERFGVMISALGVTGLLLVGASGSSAYMSNQAVLADQTVYTSTFTTSKTDLSGEVTGLYGNEAGDKVLIMMKFDEEAPISYNADDYQAFLMGAGMDLSFQDLKTQGLQGSFYVMGSTGYVGVLLTADEPFAEQVMNLTMRSNTELTRPDEEASSQELSDNEIAMRGGDTSFDQYDQWRVYVNPGADGVQKIPAMDASQFDPAQAYYDIVVKDQEKDVRSRLDSQLELMRADLQRAHSYEDDLATTKVDGLFLRPPTVPSFIDGDEVNGESAQESDDDTSTLQLRTDEVDRGGYDFDWRSGNVYDGYLDDIVPKGKSVSEFLNERNEAAASSGDASDSSDDTGASSVADMTWRLSDGSSLTDDYDSSARSMQPLFSAMNNLSGAYEAYATDKATYQTDLLSELLSLDVDVRSVESNTSVNNDEGFLTY